MFDSPNVTENDSNAFRGTREITNYNSTMTVEGYAATWKRDDGNDHP